MKYIKQKITIPTLPEFIICRPRLTKSVTGQDLKNLICIVAPAGFGKTILAIQLSGHINKKKACWYTLDNTDRDAARFIYYISVSLQSVLPELATSTILSNPSSIALNLQQARDELWSFLDASNLPNFSLTLDNWEIVNDSVENKLTVSQLCDYNFEGLHLIITSRKKPEIRLGRRVEAGQAVLFEQKNIAFNLEETEQVFSRKNNIEMSDEMLNSIWEYSEGWCATIGLLASIFNNENDLSKLQPLKSLQNRSLLTYLEEEVFTEIPPSLKSFLIQTSYIDILAPESCCFVINDIEIIQNHLKEIKNSLIPYMNVESIDHLRLHPTIQDMLQNLARHNYSKSEYNLILKKSSEYYKQEGQTLKSLELLGQANEFELFLNELSDNWLKLIELNALEEVGDWLKKIPPPFTNTNVYLKLKTNYFSNKGQNNEIISLLQDKITKDTIGKSDSTMAMLWIFYRWACMHTENPPSYEFILNEWNEINKEKGPFDIMMQVNAEIIIQYAAVQTLKPEKAISHLKNALKILPEDQFDTRMVLMSNLGLNNNDLGNTLEAKEIFQDIVTQCNNKMAYSILPLALLNYSFTCINTGDFEKAIDIAKECQILLSAGSHLQTGIEANLLKSLGLCYCYLGEKHTGIQLLKDAKEKAVNYEASLVDRINLFLALFDAQDIPVTIKLLVEYSNKIDRESFMRLANAVYYSISYEKYDVLEQAITSLDDLHAKVNIPPWEVFTNFIKAYWMLEIIKDEKKGVTFLKKGFLKLKGINWLIFPSATPKLLGFIVSRAFCYEIETELAMQIIKTGVKVNLWQEFTSILIKDSLVEKYATNAWKGAAELSIRGLNEVVVKRKENANKQEVIAIENYLEKIKEVSLPPLKIKCVGDFQVVNTYGVVNFTRKKSKQIFEYLILKMDSKVSEDILIDTFWTESEPHKAYSNLRTAIGDLRRDLDRHYVSRGQSYIVHSDGHYSVNLYNGSSIDLKEIKLLHKQIFELTDDSFDFTIKHIKKLIYAIIEKMEPILSNDLYAPWVVEYRESFTTHQLRAAGKLAQHAKKLKLVEEVGELMNACFKLDPFWTDGIEVLMHVYIESKNNIKAIQVYRAFEKKLEEELGLSPHQKLIELYQSLTHK